MAYTFIRTASPDSAAFTSPVANLAYTAHLTGRSEEQNINQFFDNGGSYSGSCAGAFVCTSGSVSYWHMWPAYCKSQDGIFLVNYYIPANSPLLNYYDFGGSLVISNVQHWNGPYVVSTNSTYWAARLGGPRKVR